MPSSPLYSSFLLRSSTVGFMCPDIADGDAGEIERTPRNPLRSFHPLVRSKTSFDSHGGCLLSLMQLGLALCRKFCPHADELPLASCLSVFVLQWAVVLNCLFGNFVAKFLTEIKHHTGKQENWIHSWPGQVLTSWPWAGQASSLALNSVVCEMGTLGRLDSLDTLGFFF